MKIQSFLARVVALAVSVVAIATADAADKKTAGPNGGRILTKIEPRAEFLVMKDRKVQITFLDKSGKAIAPADQSVTITAGDRSAPQTLTFARVGDSLVSSTPLPPGADIPAVIQIKVSPSAKAVIERVSVNMSKCGGCDYFEYACTCGH